MNRPSTVTSTVSLKKRSGLWPRVIFTMLLDRQAVTVIINGEKRDKEENWMQL
jgi:hypothetical protein